MPTTVDDLKAAVAACLSLSPVGDCSEGPHGRIGKWIVFSVTDSGIGMSPKELGRIFEAFGPTGTD